MDLKNQLAIFEKETNGTLSTLDVTQFDQVELFNKLANDSISVDKMINLKTRIVGVMFEEQSKDVMNDAGEPEVNPETGEVKQDRFILIRMIDDKGNFYATRSVGFLKNWHFILRCFPDWQTRYFDIEAFTESVPNGTMNTFKMVGSGKLSDLKNKK